MDIVQYQYTVGPTAYTGSTSAASLASGFKRRFAQMMREMMRDSVCTTPGTTVEQGTRFCRAIEQFFGVPRPGDEDGVLDAAFVQRAIDVLEHAPFDAGMRGGLQSSLLAGRANEGLLRAMVAMDESATNGRLDSAGNVNSVNGLVPIVGNARAWAMRNPVPVVAGATLLALGIGYGVYRVTRAS